MNVSNVSNTYSDYGSGCSLNSLSSVDTAAGSAALVPPRFVNREQYLREMSRSTQRRQPPGLRPRSYVDERQSLEDVMNEFKMNGFDSPFEPDEIKQRDRFAELSGMGPATAYLRQKSWPEPERSPVTPLPRALTATAAAASTSAAINNVFYGTSTTHTQASNEEAAYTGSGYWDQITAEQIRVLQSLPDELLYALLRDLQNCRDRKLKKKRLPDECRFCKNNGEREPYYRGHRLRDADGLVRCPVLRAFVCKRCGARGDHAHTIKYCPFSTEEERIQSTAMMRSVRMASGRKRTSSISAPPAVFQTNDWYEALGEIPSGIDSPTYKDWINQPLDPLWAALEQKLML